MTKREKIKDIYKTLKSGLRMCEMIETKNLSGEVIGFHQGLSFSCDDEYIYFLGSGSWAVKSSLKKLEFELDGCNLDMIVTESEFEKRSGQKFFGWRI
jgi:hypothetical protein